MVKMFIQFLSYPFNLTFTDKLNSDYKLIICNFLLDRLRKTLLILQSKLKKNFFNFLLQKYTSINS